MASKRCKNCREQRQDFCLELQGEGERDYASSCTRCNREWPQKKWPGNTNTIVTHVVKEGTCLIHGGQKRHKMLGSPSIVGQDSMCYLHILVWLFYKSRKDREVGTEKRSPFFLENCWIIQDSLLLKLSCWQHHVVKTLGKLVTKNYTLTLELHLKTKIHTGFRVVSD